MKSSGVGGAGPLPPIDVRGRAAIHHPGFKSRANSWSATSTQHYPTNRHNAPGAGLPSRVSVRSRLRSPCHMGVDDRQAARGRVHITSASAQQWLIKQGFHASSCAGARLTHPDHAATYARAVVRPLSCLPRWPHALPCLPPPSLRGSSCRAAPLDPLSLRSTSHLLELPLDAHQEDPP